MEVLKFRKDANSPWVDISSIVGAQGPVGPAGKDGKDGAIGPQGPKGDKGDKGDKGATGSTGPQGPQGIQGEKGDKGEQGPAGKDGTNGTNGKDGADGYTPVKGVDYYTETDKQEIISVIEEDIIISGSVGKPVISINAQSATELNSIYNKSITLKNTDIFFDDAQVLKIDVLGANGVKYVTLYYMTKGVNGIAFTRFDYNCTTAKGEYYNYTAITDTSLEELGYQTEEQVNALINEAINNIGIAEEVSV